MWLIRKLWECEFAGFPLCFANPENIDFLLKCLGNSYRSWNFKGFIQHLQMSTVSLLLPCSLSWSVSYYKTLYNCCATKVFSHHCQYFNYGLQTEFSKAIFDAKYHFYKFQRTYRQKKSCFVGDVAIVAVLEFLNWAVLSAIVVR